MRSKIMSAARVLVMVGIVALAAGPLWAQATTRVSVSSRGDQANRESQSSDISADGRFVAFASEATNLVSDDTNVSDVFVHDRETGEVTRVSVNSQGEQANGGSQSPAISGDGRFVAFGSFASNLVPDGTFMWDIFVRDRQTGETTRVSVDSQGGQADDWSEYPAISADGRFVAFMSYASNLVPGDTNIAYDIFVHDCQTGETTRVSVDSQGGEGNGYSFHASISGDGRFVAFGSWATNLVSDDTNGIPDMFVHDRQTGETTRVSVDSQGGQGLGGPWLYWGFCDISVDGRFVAFSSWATNLVADDTNNSEDVFVHDRQTGETTRVSVDSQGGQGDGDSSHPAISVEGRFVAFDSGATNLTPADTNAALDVFVHDCWTRETTRVSVDSLGGQANRSSHEPSAVSGDGRVVAFESDATNLVAVDTNNRRDVFVHDRAPGPCTLPASWTSYGSGWPGTNGVPALVARSNPVLCVTLEVFADNSSGVATSGVFLAGDRSVNRWTPWGGTVLVLPAVVMSVLVPADGLSITSTVPCDDALCGMKVFAQVLEMDPGASRGVSFTPGLELRLGVE